MNEDACNGGWDLFSVGKVDVVIADHDKHKTDWKVRNAAGGCQNVVGGNEGSSASTYSSC